MLTFFILSHSLIHHSPSKTKKKKVCVKAAPMKRHEWEKKLTAKNDHNFILTQGTGEGKNHFHYVQIV